MATTYTATKAASTKPAKAHIGLTAVHSIYEAGTALVVNDVLQMVRIPAGATILDMTLSVDDLDTGTNLVLDVGDGDDTDRYIDGSTAGQAGGIAKIGSGVAAGAAANGACVGYKYTVEDTIDVLVQVAPAGGGTGTVDLYVLYTLDE